MTIPINSAVRAGRGAHSGRYGTVEEASVTAYRVRFQAPVIHARPAGPTRTLPYGRRENNRMA